MDENQNGVNDGGVTLTVDENPFKRGSNPSYSTARSKLQKKRSRINDDIIKELRLRKGAENLLRVATNKEVREKVIIELGFVKSKLEVLKADLAQLNSSVKTYQNENSGDAVPMISLGLKETKDANFRTVFMDYIEEHYSEPGDRYVESINKLHALRKATRTPERNESGIELLTSYVEQLTFVEKRFYPPGRSVPVFFTWYDSLTGVLATQKTIGYEKGCILFNIAALYSQVGTAQDRSSLNGLEKTVDYYQKSAGMMKYLRDRFTHAPTLDMNPETLTLLIQLLLSQGQECLYEKMMLDRSPKNFLEHMKCAQEAAMVSKMYDETYNAVASKPFRTDVPSPWITMTNVKINHYLALAHYHLASALLLAKEQLPSFNEVKESLEKATEVGSGPTKNHQYSEDKKRQVQYCRAHLKEALNLNEIAQKDYNFCRALRSDGDAFLIILGDFYTKVSTMLIEVSDETEYEDIFFSLAAIIPSTENLVNVTSPSFKSDEKMDFFNGLGPIKIFAANTEWTTPKNVSLNRDSTLGFGFTIKGESPSIIVEIDDGSPADLAELKVGDILTKVNNNDVKWASQKGIKTYMAQHGDEVQLSVISPMESANSKDSPTESDDTVTSVQSILSSSDGEDMKQLNTLSWKGKKINNLTFLKNKKTVNSNDSLRKQ